MVAKQTHPHPELPELARLLRSWLIRMTTTAGSDHLSSSLSAVEVMVGLLFGGAFRADVKRPGYANNDRLLFSKGHAAPLLYSLYALAGMVRPRDLLGLRTMASKLEGHPTIRFPYTEVPTGSLGQGLSVALGEAIAAGMGKLTYRTYCLLGDSEMAEGSVWEAIQLAGYRHQAGLVAIVDVNGLGQAGPTMAGHNPLVLARRAQAFGWRTIVIDGHNFRDILHALAHAETITDHPVMILAKTQKGRGVAVMEGKDGWHGRVLTKPQAHDALQHLGRVDEKLRGRMSVPDRRQPKRGAKRSLPVFSYKLGDVISPREAAGHALVRIGTARPEVVVFDGEVMNSTDTDRFAKKWPRRFIQGYIAEQNIVGMALGVGKRGYVPVAATFGAFWTRAFDQLRMASYASVPMVIIGTHAGVHIGQDGMSQMALQDIAMFRTLEHSTIFYPADAVAAEKCLEVAVRHDAVTYLRLTRAKFPVIYPSPTRFTVGGSHVLRQSDHDTATVVAAGVTLYEALKAADILAKKKISVRVIDLYSLKPIDAATLKRAVRETKRIIVVEDHYPEGGMAEAVRTALGTDAGCVVSLAVRKTPRSGTPEELLAYEGIDAAGIVREVMRKI